MKKILTTILLALFIFKQGFTQSISPAESTEFCPLTNTTFTVTLPIIANGSTISVVSWTNGPTVIGVASNITSNTNTQTTTFTFVGSFEDVNINQVFKITYRKASDPNTDVYYFPSFKKIKSLYHPNPTSTDQNSPCQPFRANQNSITAAICQIVSTPISVNETKWSTYGEGNDFCWGSITTYEYQLPSGWSIGSNVSTGSNWIAGGTNVTVTSDMTTGANGIIKIRPANNCGSGLANNVLYAEILILRPAPPLSITGSSYMCSGSSYTYTLNGVPAGGVINWSNTNSYYNLVASGNTATVTPTSAANGSTTINASVTLPTCGLTFPVAKTISIGAPYVTFNIVGYPYPEPNCYEVGGIYSFQANQATGYPNTFTGYQWGYRNLTTGTTSNDPTIYGSQYTFIPESAGQYEIFVKPTNQCGAGALESVKTVTVNETCSGGFMSQQNSINVFPNPAKNKVKVQIPKEFRKNCILQLTSQFGMVVYAQKINTENATVDIDISRLKEGVYQLTLKAGNNTRQGKLIKH